MVYFFIIFTTLVVFIIWYLFILYVMLYLEGITLVNHYKHNIISNNTQSDWGLSIKPIINTTNVVKIIKIIKKISYQINIYTYTTHFQKTYPINHIHSPSIGTPSIFHLSSKTKNPTLHNTDQYIHTLTDENKVLNC